LTFLKELLEAGKVVPVIDRRYPLSEAADALRYLETHQRAVKSSWPSSMVAGLEKALR